MTSVTVSEWVMITDEQFWTTYWRLTAERNHRIPSYKVQEAVLCLMRIWRPDWLAPPNNDGGQGRGL